jgi:hypothetical protein
MYTVTNWFSSVTGVAVTLNVGNRKAISFGMLCLSLIKQVKQLSHCDVFSDLGLCGGCSFLGCNLSSPFSRGEGAPLCGDVGSSLASSTTNSWNTSVLH